MGTGSKKQKVNVPFSGAIDLKRKQTHLWGAKLLYGDRSNRQLKKDAHAAPEGGLDKTRWPWQQNPVFIHNKLNYL